jgi:hypothetical protein
MLVKLILGFRCFFFFFLFSDFVSVFSLTISIETKKKQDFEETAFKKLISKLLYHLNRVSHGFKLTKEVSHFEYFSTVFLIEHQFLRQLGQ